MAQERLSVPTSGGGIVRYFEEQKSKLQLKPEHVLIAVGVVVLVILFFHKFSPLG